MCAFVPRLSDFHPDAVPAPYNHSNVMSDEVLYYANDEFMSRKGIEYGSMTLHPLGLPHGPQPGRMEASIGKERTDELAVMIDTFKPLFVAKTSLGVEDKAYPESWLKDN
jgi:homogentisate 1,2-dioxygenase